VHPVTTDWVASATRVSSSRAAVTRRFDAGTSRYAAPEDASKSSNEFTETYKHKHKHIHKDTTEQALPNPTPLNHEPITDRRVHPRARKSYVQTLNPKSYTLNPSQTGECIQELERAHTGYVSSLAMQGDYIMSSSFDRTICLWNAERRSLVKSIKAHAHCINALWWVTLIPRHWTMSHARSMNQRLFIEEKQTLNPEP